MTDQPHDSVTPPPPPSPLLPPPPAPSTLAATTLASPPGLPAFHPRGMLVATALGGPLKRASWVAGISAVLLVLLLSTVLGTQSSILLVPVVAAIAAIGGAALAAVTMPPRSRRAFETFAWLGSREMRRFEARTGSKVPTDPAAVQRWLHENPRSSATAWGRLELLAMLGRTDEAAAEQALMPPPATDAEAVEQALARRFTGFIATGTADESELDALQARLSPDTDLGLELLVARAIGQARSQLAAARDDWRDPLLAVRPRLGWAATMTVVRDLWSKIAILVFVVALAIGLLTAMWPR
jgi:hypothetical protein